jgi:hydrophobic/amphiphilic exporter-1 (mainly G- bacteria), HAE1 family
MLASKWMPQVQDDEEHVTGGRFNPLAAFQRGLIRLNRAYGRVLRWALGHRKTVIVATIAMFAGSVALVPLIGFELAPNVDQGHFKVSIQMANGTRLDETNQVTTKVENVIRQMPEVTTVFTQVGGAGGGPFGTASTDKANIQVNLKPLAERSRSTDQVVEEVRKKVANIPGARIRVSASSTGFGSGGSGGSPIEVQISGDDEKVLQKLSDEVEQVVESVQGTRNVQSSLDKQVPQYQVNVDRQLAAQYGLSVGQIVSAIRSAYQGAVATQFHAVDSSIDVIVEYPETFSRQIENLSSVTIAAQNGGQVALSDVASIVPSVGPAQISRTNQTRTITVSADLFNVNQGMAQNEVAAKIAQIPVPDGYTIGLGGSRNDLNDSFKSLGLAMPLAIVLVYMVMASQFESLFSPFIIMFSMPPTFIGAAIGLVLTHRALSISALTGMIMLIGIVVNNAIVLVDYTNQLRKKGMERNEALLAAGPVRLRPILMTTATTVLAMLPLVIGFGEGGEAQAPMATVVAFGLTFSTLVTLVLIPVVYTLFDDFGNFIRRIFRRKNRVQMVDPTLPMSK